MRSRVVLVSPMTPNNTWSWSWASAAGHGLLVAGEAVAELGQRAGQQPGHVHLGDAELGRDLGLGHVAEEAQQQDLLLARRQLLEQRFERLAVLHALQRVVHHAE